MDRGPNAHLSESGVFVTFRYISQIQITTVAVCACLVLISGCATATPYKPAENGKHGYRDAQIEDGKYRVSFLGNALTSKETVEIYLLYRAADITLANGFEHFQLVNYSTQAKTDYGVMGPAMSGIYPHSGVGFPYYAYGYPWAGSTHITSRTKYEAVAYVHMLDASEAKGRENVYSAKEVKASLEPRVARPS